ncbi:MAG: acetylglutamate kinase, partial [Chloroflexi bacterium]|nr:acetylglutamate kinase [Chloroflexota bacterium]
MPDILVAKIGGSTFGGRDTTLEDVVALHGRGVRPVVVHGGGNLISEWLERHGVATRFHRGLRVTDAETLKVAVAVLAGLVNKEVVAGLEASGGRALGISGADGGLLRARRIPDLGYVGEIVAVNVEPLLRLLDDGFIPVIAPIAVEWQGQSATGQLLNVNADTVAGELARALGAARLVFLTDVLGVLGGDGRPVGALAAAEAQRLLAEGTVGGGMIPKVQAALSAAAAGIRTLIIDGRAEHALSAALEGR